VFVVRLAIEVNAGLRGRLPPGESTLGYESKDGLVHSSMGREGGPRERGSRGDRLKALLFREVAVVVVAERGSSFNAVPLNPSGFMAEPNDPFDSYEGDGDGGNGLYEGSGKVCDGKWWWWWLLARPAEAGGMKVPICTSSAMNEPA
jgi:hypothetical protein